MIQKRNERHRREQRYESTASKLERLVMTDLLTKESQAIHARTRNDCPTQGLRVYPYEPQFLLETL